MGGAKSKGVNPYAILEKAKVPPDILENLQTQVPITIYYRILAAIREHLQDEMLGFLDHRIPPRAFSVFCEAATGCPDFKSLLKFANDFYGLLTDEFCWEMKNRGWEKIDKPIIENEKGCCTV